MILHECFHRLVAGQAEGIITLGRLTVPVFGALPEQAFVVTQERRTLHLALMPEDGIAFLTQFLWTHRHAHLDVGHIPFRPGPSRQSFNHSAPAFFSSSMAANTASVHLRWVP